MAGVAPQRSGGSNASTIGLIVSILVSVALLVFIVIMFTGQEQLRSNEKKAKDDLARIAAGGDRDAANKFIADAGGSAQTLMGNTVKAATMLVGRMTGNATDSAKQAADKLDAALAEIVSAGKVPNPDQMSQSNGAVAIIQQLHSWFAAERAAKETALADLAKANADLEAAINSQKALNEKYAGDYKKLSDTVAAMQKNKSEFESTKNADIDALKKTIDSKADEVALMTKEKRSLEQTYATELTKADKIIEDQRRALGQAKGPGPVGAQALAVARKPVGQIMRAGPGSPIVHVNLGKRERLSPGMTLAVYGAEGRVPDTGRGKANLEVVSVGERTSECRVVTPASPDDPILEGDGVGNILLSRNVGKKQRFCIVGRFDVNYDGQPDVRGLEAVQAFVRRFGGEVVDSVDATTDYLIVGTPPPDSEPVAPVAKADEEEKPADEAAADDEKPADEGGEGEEGDKPAADKKPAPKAIEKPKAVDHPQPPRTRRAMSERGLYDEAIRKADSLMVPRLTQDHFFNFLGIEAGPNVAKRVLD